MTHRNNHTESFQIKDETRSVFQLDATILSFIVTMAVVVTTFWFKRRKSSTAPPSPPTPAKALTKLIYGTVNYGPLKVKPVSPDFEWDKVEPIKLYPFKDGDYKLTMGIKTITADDWLMIEPTYKLRIEAKRLIIRDQHPDYAERSDIRESTVFCASDGIDLVREYYDVVVDYMCQKYPQYFVIDGDEIHNKIMDCRIPAKAGERDPEQLLEYLVDTIEEDFIILKKDPTQIGKPNGDEYHFKAGVFAFAAGFNPSDRFNKPLLFIHHPIPGYEEKLKVLMNRFFTRLAPGNFVTRSNFSVQTHHKLFTDDQNKGHNLPKGYVQTPLDYDSCDFDHGIHYRSERQVLTKLPKTDAIVFTIRTYLMPMSHFKYESPEVRRRFAGQIRGIPDDIGQYKRSWEWGPPVIRYLTELNDDQELETGKVAD